MATPDIRKIEETWSSAGFPGGPLAHYDAHLPPAEIEFRYKVPPLAPELRGKAKEDAEWWGTCWIRAGATLVLGIERHGGVEKTTFVLTPRRVAIEDEIRANLVAAGFTKKDAAPSVLDRAHAVIDAYKSNMETYNACAISSALVLAEELVRMIPTAGHPAVEDPLRVLVPWDNPLLAHERENLVATAGHPAVEEESAFELRREYIAKVEQLEDAERQLRLVSDSYASVKTANDKLKADYQALQQERDQIVVKYNQAIQDIRRAWENLS